MPFWAAIVQLGNWTRALLSLVTVAIWTGAEFFGCSQYTWMMAPGVLNLLANSVSLFQLCWLAASAVNLMVVADPVKKPRCGVRAVTSQLLSFPTARMLAYEFARRARV